MTQGRWGALDAARGLAVVAMIVFHVIWDLAHFGYVDANVPWSAPVRYFGHSIAFAFLFIAGVALVLAHRDGLRWRAFWRRFAIIAGAAALVSVGTYVLFPTTYVFFGILHCIAAASLIAVPFLRAPWPLALGAAVFFLAGAELFSSPVFNANWLLWLGLSTSEPMTQDWRPIFPWAGALLMGVAIGRVTLSLRGEGGCEASGRGVASFVRETPHPGAPRRPSPYGRGFSLPGPSQPHHLSRASAAALRALHGARLRRAAAHRRERIRRLMRSGLCRRRRRSQDLP